MRDVQLAEHDYASSLLPPRRTTDLANPWDHEIFGTLTEKSVYAGEKVMRSSVTLSKN